MHNSGLHLQVKVELTHSKMCRWEKDEEERRIKEEGKREKIALATWRKLLMGLRIIERVREEYGGGAEAHIAEEMNPFTNPSRTKKALQADTVTNTALSRGPFSYADDIEDIGGGFLADDDDPNSGGFLPEGHDAVEVRRRAGELTIEDEKDPVDKGSMNGSPSADPDVMNCGPPDTDDSEGTLTEADLEDKVTVAQTAATDGKKAAATVTSPKGNVSTYYPKRRVAPKRKAARKSGTALKSHFCEDEDDEDDDEDDNSNRGMLRSKEVAVKKPAKGKW